MPVSIHSERPTGRSMEISSAADYGRLHQLTSVSFRVAEIQWLRFGSELELFKAYSRGIPASGKLWQTFAADAEIGEADARNAQTIFSPWAAALQGLRPLALAICDLVPWQERTIAEWLYSRRPPTSQIW